MIARRKREKARNQRQVDLDRADVDVTEILSNLEAAVRKYDNVRERFLRIIRPVGH